MNVTNKIFKFWDNLFEFNFSREGSELLQLGFPNSRSNLRNKIVSSAGANSLNLI